MLSKLKKLLSLTLVLSLLFVTTVSASAANIPDSDNNMVVSLEDFSNTDLQFFDKFSSVLNGYYTNEFGEISFSYTPEDLAALGFSETDLRTLAEINSRVCGTIIPEEDTIVLTRVFLEDGKVYFDNADIHALLLGAASLGPEALYAAIVGISTLVGGPVGTAVSGILGFLGAASLGYLCYLIIQAAANGQGIYIGIEMNGIFPNIVSGTW